MDQQEYKSATRIMEESMTLIEYSVHDLGHTED
jgi:hypothetical protein